MAVAAAAAAAAAIESSSSGAALAAFAQDVAVCTRCTLSEARTQVVFGAGSPTAELMFVGEAPGFHEDKQGVPFVGAAGTLLGKLLRGIGLARDDVYIANVLKCLGPETPVQLGDGSWESIASLVGSRYAGTVMSVDAEGALVARRVTGWHASPLGGRRLFRLRERSAGSAAGAAEGVELTGDHPVLTRRGYVPVQMLLPGDMVATGEGLSELAHDVVCGALLGNGTIERHSGSLRHWHSDAEEAYAFFIARLLGELGASVARLTLAARAGGVPAPELIEVCTAPRGSLRALGMEFDAGRKRIPVWIADRLNDRVLAIWFMDRGSTRPHASRRLLVELGAEGLAEQDVRVLLAGLSRLGLPAESHRGRIVFDLASSKALLERIAPYVPGPMRSRLGPALAASIPFDETLLAPGPRRAVFAEVELEEVTERPGPDTTFFCIDVERTHCFVTAGGVVHNCRPPANRDPRPEEIESCESHLFRQIELIRPRVVVSLGNFATKLLSGRPDGITRVHGVEQEVVLGGLRVLLYPIYHPAAALYTPRMLNVLEADFRRLPALLAREAPAPLVPATAPHEAIAEDPGIQLGLF